MFPSFKAMGQERPHLLRHHLYRGAMSLYAESVRNSSSCEAQMLPQNVSLGSAVSSGTRELFFDST